jgi:mersacidin/lichenicidin family type 2 lantibiotic
VTTLETVKAWKDEEYRDTLTQTDREKLPAHPAGVMELEAPKLGDWHRFGAVNRHSFFFCTFDGPCLTIKGGHCK